MNRSTNITAEKIDALLSFLDEFEKPDFSVSEWQTPPGQFQWLKTTSIVQEFHLTLYRDGWILESFDWPEWQPTARQYVNDPTMMDSADILTIQKLLTTYSRRDHFCEGFFADSIQHGQIPTFLRRLRAIRQEMV
jgi:hypothetical protein